MPAFGEARALVVETTAGPVSVDVAFGGAFYASVDARLLGLGVEPVNVHRFIALGRELKHALEAEREFVHPVEPELRDVYGVIFFEHVASEPTFTQRNITVFADGEVDRSPCGSGTSARLALLDASGELPRGARLLHASVLGTQFSACVVGEAEVAGRSAVVTEVEGSAHRTGTHEFVLHDRDPLGTGFLLR